MRLIGIVGAVFLCCVGIAYAAPVELYVSPHGNDAWSGALDAPNAAESDGPFATLTAARDALRAMKAAKTLPPEGAIVHIRHGEYFQAEPFTLEAQDSGPEGGVIEYTSFGGDQPYLTGGKEVGPFTPVTDEAVLQRLQSEARTEVVTADLSGLGIDDYGTWNYQWASAMHTPVELFYDYRPMTVCRWPNTGWLHVSETPDGRTGTSVVMDTDLPRTWAEPQKASAWGYWTWDWAEDCIGIATVAPGKRRIDLTEPETRYGITPGARFFICNVLEELDAPGEYYIDTAAQRLYFWPPPVYNGVPKAYVSITSGPLLIAKDVANVSLSRLHFAYTRGGAIALENCRNVSVLGCHVRFIGGTAITVSGGDNNEVRSCSLRDLGEGGITISGGDRQTLTPSSNRALNNTISHFGRLRWTYHPGISASGVGIHIAHNLIHDAAHAGIIWSGNDMVIEYNELHHLLLDTHDCGAIYCGRDFTMRGNRIAYNFIHNLATGSDRHAVYLDDMFSSVDVVGNIFWKASNGVFLGGGRDNLIENNLFVSCCPGILVDNRGVNSEHFYDTAKKSLERVPYNKPPYSTRYPKLATLLKERPREPMGNRIAHNIFADTEPWLSAPGYLLEEGILAVEDNFTSGDPGLVDPAHGAFRLRLDAPARRIDFTPPPFEKMGLVTDEFICAVPDRAQTGAYIDVPPDPLPPAPADEVIYPCPRRTAPVVIDGKLDEWSDLPIVCTNPAQVRVLVNNWTGPEDNSFRFATAYDDQYLYIALQVTDDRILAEKRRAAWYQDGVELRLDARPKPLRDEWRGESENAATLLIALSPGQGLNDMIGLDPADLPEGTQACCKENKDGYAFEVAIPTAYLTKMQEGAWNSFRMNLNIDDLDHHSESNIVQLCWKPDWRTSRNYVGSGTFARQD